MPLFSISIVISGSAPLLWFFVQARACVNPIFTGDLEKEMDKNQEIEAKEDDETGEENNAPIQKDKKDENGEVEDLDPTKISKEKLAFSGPRILYFF